MNLVCKNQEFMWTIEEYKGVYARYESSGLSASDFCQNEQISRSRFYYWLKKYRKIKGVNISPARGEIATNRFQSQPRFIPLVIDSDVQSNLRGVYPVKRASKSPPVHCPPVPEAFMEITYPDGTTVRLIGEKDIELVKTLIHLSR